MRKITLLLLGFLLLGSVAVMAQSKFLTGVVTSNSDGQPIPGVAVAVKGTTLGTVTGVDGKFTLQAPSSAKTLQLSFIGMKNLEVEIGTQTNFNIKMETDVFSIEEVVAVGYGVQKKREVTGSITSVKGDELASLASPSFDTQLAGRAAGVQVSQQTGVLGETPRLRIRGVGSISSGTYPLIIVDGIPVFTGDQGGYANGSNALGDINPNDIESMEILKDGSATAIYGSRAANGVLIITTKKGKSGKFKMNYSNYFGVASPVKVFDLLHTDDFITISNEKRSNAGQSVIAVDNQYDTDWQKAVLRQNAFQMDHNLSLSGATERNSYYFSLGYTNQEGIAKPNTMVRYTIRANMDQQVRKWMKVGANIGVTKTEYDGMLAGANNLSGNIFSAMRQLPNTPIYDEKDPTGYNIDDLNPQLVGRWKNTLTIGDNLPNIVYVLDKNVFGTKVFHTIGNAFASFDPVSYLNFKTQLSVDNSISEGLLYYNPIHGDGSSSMGRVQNNYRNANRWNWQNVLSFNKTLAEYHNISAVFVNEFEFTRTNSFYGVGTNLSNEFFRYNLIDGSYSTQQSGGSLSENGFISYAGRLNYNFKDKYYLQASVRYDGISSLPQKNRYGVFPGGSIGWNVAREPFMHSLNHVVSDFKLRASYAEVGNVSIGNYPYAGLYSSYPYADYNGIAFSQAGNTELKWETSKKTDFGFDMMFYGGKYKFTFDYYMNNQDGLILAVPTPMSVGIPGNSINKNIGSLKNWGYEFSGEAVLLKTDKLTWSVDANLTLAKNKVLSLYNHQDINLTYTIIRENESIRSIFGYDYRGVNAANGNPIYAKADGTLIQGNIAANTSYYIYNPDNPSVLGAASSLAAADRKILGPSLPTFFGGVNTKLAFMGFDFAVMARFSGGNYIMNKTRDDLTNQNFTNNSAEILGRWQSADKPGDGWTPKLWFGNTNFINKSGETNSRFVEKGDFFKISTIVLGYTLPKNIVGKAGIDNLRVYVQGQELFMFTKYTGLDPEGEGRAGVDTGVDYNGTPRQSVISAGLNITF